MAVIDSAGRWCWCDLGGAIGARIAGRIVLRLHRAPWGVRETLCKLRQRLAGTRTKINHDPRDRGRTDRRRRGLAIHTGSSRVRNTLGTTSGTQHRRCLVRHRRRRGLSQRRTQGERAVELASDRGDVLTKDLGQGLDLAGSPILVLARWVGRRPCGLIRQPSTAITSARPFGERNSWKGAAPHRRCWGSRATIEPPHASSRCWASCSATRAAETSPASRFRRELC
jgi:hypothetical protein